MASPDRRTRKNTSKPTTTLSAVGPALVSNRGGFEPSIASAPAEHGELGRELDRPDRRLRPLHVGSARTDLELAVRSPSLPHRIVLRSRIVLLLAAGHSAREVVRMLSVSRRTVDLWRERFENGGFVALLTDKPGRGRKRR